MKRYAASVALAIALTMVFASGLAAQDSDSIVLAYRRNFARASLVTKLELVKEAAASKGAAMGPLYDMAIRFAYENASLLGSDQQLKDLALLAAAQAGEARYAKSIDNLWSLFQAYKDPEVRAEAIRALGLAGSGESRVSENLGAFLASQNSLFRSGAQPEYPALEACIEALGLLGDGSSFPVLFSAYVAGYSPELATKAALALGQIKGDYQGYLLQVIARNPPLEKAAAFSAGMKNPAFDERQLGELAEGAMTAALEASEETQTRSPVELQALREMRLGAARQFKELKWQRASSLAIKHFRIVQADYAKGAAAKSELLEAVACLGAMGSTEAAQTLALHLQLINAQTEQGAPYDEPLVLAVIAALGELGDKAAFDYLLQMGYLQYTDTVKRAAREALLRLKW